MSSVPLEAGTSSVGDTAATATSVASNQGASSAAACQNCGETLLGDYCHACGEKRPGARDLSLRHFMDEATQELTSVERSKIFRTVFALLFRPGFLTLEWIAGRRLRYLKPLNLCLGIFALNLFAYTATKQVTTFDIKLILQNEQQMTAEMKLEKSGAFTRLINGIAERKRISTEEVQDRINERWQRNISLYQIPQIVLMALLLQAVYIFSRSYFVEHLVFALHFLAFTSLTIVLLWPVYYLIGMNPTRLNFLVAFGKFALDILYLFVALRAVYRGSVAIAALRAFVVFGGYFVLYVLTYVAALLTAVISIYRS